MKKISVLSFALCASMVIVSCQATKPAEQIVIAEKKAERTMSDSEATAMKYFVDGTILEMQEKQHEAILEYQTALRYAPLQPTVLYSLAKNYLKIGKHNEALEFLEKSVKAGNEDEEAFLELAKLYVEHKRHLDALSIVVRMFSLKIKDKNSFYNLVYSLALALSGIDHQEVDYRDKAIELLTTYTNKFGFDQKMMFAKFDLLIKKKDYVRAIDVLKSFIENHEENPDIYQMLGESYEAVSNFEKAEEAYKKASELVPRDLKQRLALLNFYVVAKKWDTFSRESYKTIVTMAPERSDYLSILYAFQQKSEKEDIYVKATIYFGKEILRHDPNDLLTSLTIGDIWLKQKQYDSAEVIYRTSLKKNPDQLAIIDGLARSLAAQKKTNEAIQLIIQAISSFPDQKGNLQSYLGYLYYDNGMNEACIKTLEEAEGEVLKNETKVQNYLLLGLVYDRVDQFKKSEENYRKAIAIDPKHPTVLNNLAYLWSEQGINLQEGFEMVEMAIEKEPDNPSFLDTKGWVLYKMGKYEEARIFIEKSLQFEEKNAVVQEHLGDVLLKIGDHDGTKRAWRRALELGADKVRIEKKINESGI